MKTLKNQTQRANKNTGLSPIKWVVVLVVILILVAGFYWYKRNNDYRRIVSSPKNDARKIGGDPNNGEGSLTTTEYTFPLDTENDGVYTSYNHRFKLKYPKEIFRFQENLEISATTVRITANKVERTNGDPWPFSENQIMLYISSYRIPEEMLDEKKASFKQRLDDDSGTKKDNIFTIWTKIENINLGEINAYTETIVPTIVYVDEPNYYNVYGRSLKALKDDIEIEITLFVKEESDIEKNKALFDEIVRSFEIISEDEIKKARDTNKPPTESQNSESEI